MSERRYLRRVEFSERRYSRREREESEERCGEIQTSDDSWAFSVILLLSSPSSAQENALVSAYRERARGDDGGRLCVQGKGV